MRTRLVAPAVAAILLGGCSGATADSTAPTSTTSTTQSGGTRSTGAPEATTGSTEATAPTISTEPTTAPTADPITSTSAPEAIGYVATATEVPAEVRARMDGISMRPGCPVGYEDLRYLRLSHWDFDGAVRTGELVVHDDVADDVVAAFRSLFDARFPIRQMRLVDDFGPADDPTAGADDWASIEADNTSAFNCRLRTGSDAEWSEHSWGRAIDINPIENPYVSASGRTSHAASVPYLDRATSRPGVITADGPVVAAFAAIGWQWGGTWVDVRDYQHVSRGGR